MDFFSFFNQEVLAQIKLKKAEFPNNPIIHDTLSSMMSSDSNLQ